MWFLWPDASYFISSFPYTTRGRLANERKNFNRVCSRKGQQVFWLQNQSSQKRFFAPTFSLPVFASDVNVAAASSNSNTNIILKNLKHHYDELLRRSLRLATPLACWLNSPREAPNWATAGMAGWVHAPWFLDYVCERGGRGGVRSWWLPRIVLIPL